MSFRGAFQGKRRLVIWGALLAGLGLGACPARTLDIFGRAHPQSFSCDDSGCNTTLYPTAAVTVFALLVFCAASGVGVGLVASALIRNEDAAN